MRFASGSEEGSINMNDSYRTETTDCENDKKLRKVPKSPAPASIAERYMELRRLRAQLSEAEAPRNAS
jgi:hypothetical protein